MDFVGSVILPDPATCAMKINTTNHLLFKESNSRSLLNSCLDIACEAIAALNGEVQFLCAGPPHSSFDLMPFGIKSIKALCRFTVAFPVRTRVRGSCSNKRCAAALPQNYRQEKKRRQGASSVNVSAFAENIRECLSISAEARNRAARCPAEQYN